MENQPNQHCRNCGHLLPPPANFCPRCGQKNTDGRLTIGQLVQEFFSNLFNLDAKIFRTLAALAVPGKLTRQYFQGRHVPFYHPVRLFIVAGAVLVTVISLSINREGLKDMDNDWQRYQQRYYKHQHFRQLEAISDSTARQFGKPAVAAAFDTLLLRFSEGKDLATDSIELPLSVAFYSSDAPATHSEVVKVSIDDVVTLSPDSLAGKYGVHDFWQRMMLIQQLRIRQSGENFVFYVIGNILWMMLVMMPVLALVLKLLYIRRGQFYFEHLVFSFHTHTFTFLLLALLLILVKWMHGSIFAFGAFLMAGYLLLAMKRFYGQGWGKTILKFFLVNWMYLVTLVFAAFLIGLASVFLF